MKEEKKNQGSVSLVITLIMSAIAIFTSLKVAQFGTKPIAPSVPSSIPEAAGG